MEMIFEFCIFTAAVKDHEWHWEKRVLVFTDKDRERTRQARLEREGKKGEKGRKREREWID